MEDKKSIRQEVRRRIKSMSDEQKQHESAVVFAAIEATSVFRAATCVALFAAMWDEVPEGDAEVAAADIDLMIVPARAFTPQGDRLGRGGGFYDKYMSLPDFHAVKYGVAFACQIFDSLPTDDHDIPVERVFIGE